MGLVTALIDYMKGDIKMTHPQSFLNVNQAQNSKAFWTILAIKCLIAGYGTKYLVPKNWTTAMIAANVVSILILGISLSIPFITFYNIVADGGMLAHDGENGVLMILCWVMASLDVNLQFLLDVYCILTVLMFIFKMFDNEYEKALTLICTTLCVDWCIDNYHSHGDFIYNDCVITIFFQIGYFISLVPSRRQYFLCYVFICALLIVWTIFKYSRIIAAQEKIEYPAAYPAKRIYETVTSLPSRLAEAVKQWFGGKVFLHVETYMHEMLSRWESMYVTKSVETGEDITTLILDMTNSSSGMDVIDM